MHPPFCQCTLAHAALPNDGGLDVDIDGDLDADLDGDLKVSLMVTLMPTLMPTLASQPDKVPNTSNSGRPAEKPRNIIAQTRGWP